jgi:hypothetical protein
VVAGVTNSRLAYNDRTFRKVVKLMTSRRSAFAVRNLTIASMLAMATLLCVAADLPVALHKTGAAIARVKGKRGDRVIWSGNNWKAEFKGRTPCQNGRRVFTSSDAAGDRVCVISVVCTASDRSGCGVYKYYSSADGGAAIDPEIEVEPGN